jgi:hypothetical protein
MKLLVLVLLCAFIIAVHRHARTGFVTAYCIAAYMLFCAMLSGCATERPSPGPTPTGYVCGEHDGTYQLLNCKSYFP